MMLPGGLPNRCQTVPGRSDFVQTALCSVLIAADCGPTTGQNAQRKPLQMPLHSEKKA